MRPCVEPIRSLREEAGISQYARCSPPIECSTSRGVLSTLWPSMFALTYRGRAIVALAVVMGAVLAGRAFGGDLQSAMEQSMDAGPPRDASSDARRDAGSGE